MNGFRLLSMLVLLAVGCGVLRGQEVDSDGDGLSDAVEQALLMQFAPSFLVGKADCSGVPAEFAPDISVPVVKTEDGTIYGEVFRPKGREGAVEVHYYHLWRRDCGGHGHPLDAEHVAVLVRKDAGVGWKAVYWYAAAHEDTVCDVSQIARASTLKAEDRGAKVWISPGKHASYLNETLCRRGCGADWCGAMVPLKIARLINLGEPGRAMNGSSFLASGAWPLAGKMERTNFPGDAVARLERLPETEIGWFRAGRHPAQGVIAISSSTERALAAGVTNTGAAVGVAEDSTGGAISVAGDATGNAVGKSYRKVVGAVGRSMRRVGKALGVTGEGPK